MFGMKKCHNCHILKMVGSTNLDCMAEESKDWYLGMQVTEKKQVPCIVLIQSQPEAFFYIFDV